MIQCYEHKTDNILEGLFMSEILELIMIISFGASWPLNVIKSYKARTAKGKSIAFICLIIFGYIAGITGKLLNEAYMSNFSHNWYVLFFYVLNLIMVCADLALYFRNLMLDRMVLDCTASSCSEHTTPDLLDE